MAKKSSEHSWCCCCGSHFWGWFLLVIGIYFLAVSLGWLSKDVPFWPIVAIVIGIYILLKYHRK